MADARLEVALGKNTFSGEGTETWLAEQLDKILSYATRDLAGSIVGEPEEDPQTLKESSSPNANIAPLGKFLQDKSATTNQVLKFLATAVWCQDRLGQKEITTSDVATALRDNHQSRLSNPAKELGRNIGKGLCEKSGKGFFVTQEGRSSLN